MFASPLPCRLQVGLILGIGLTCLAASRLKLCAAEPATADQAARPADRQTESAEKSLPAEAAAGAEASKTSQKSAKGNPLPEEDRKTEDDSDNETVKEIFSGQVLLLTEALKRKGVTAYPEELKGQVVLETRTGELWPIVPDWRGRAFYQDKRLRNRPVDLIAHHAAGVPYLQVLSIYTFDEQGARQLTDYWCDICSIPMYEIKDCECCQGPIRLRFREKDLPHDLLRHQAPEDPRPAPAPGSKAVSPK